MNTDFAIFRSGNRLRGKGNAAEKEFVSDLFVEIFAEAVFMEIRTSLISGDGISRESQRLTTREIEAGIGAKKPED